MKRHERTVGSRSGRSAVGALAGTDRTPAYRGLAYVVMERLYITPYGNRLPQLSFEVEA